MKVKYSDRKINQIVVDTEDDIDLSYLWKWGKYKSVGGNEYIINPPENNPRITFQSALRNLARISNES